MAKSIIVSDKYKTVRIGDYIFVLTFSTTTPNQILSSHFLYDKDRHRDMTKAEMEKGYKLQHDIFNGKYKEVVDNTNWDVEYEDTDV